MTDSEFDPLPYLPHPPAALAANLHTTALRLAPAIVRAHPQYRHEVLLVRPRSDSWQTEWTLPERAPPAGAEKMGGALRRAVVLDTGLGVRGVLGGGLLDGPSSSSSSSGSSSPSRTGGESARRASASTTTSSASAGSAHDSEGEGASAESRAVFYVVVAEGAVTLDEERYDECMWAKGAELPALQVAGEARRAAGRALELAGLRG